MRHAVTLITVAYIVVMTALPALGGSADPEPDPAGIAQPAVI
jgi:hypothetical protein